MSIEKRMHWAVQEQLFTPRISDLSNMAWAHLNYGPFSPADFSEESPNRETQWPGWESATAEMSQWANDLGDRWYSTEDEILLSSEPQVDLEFLRTQLDVFEDLEAVAQAEWEFLSSTTIHLDPRALKRILFGEVAEYL